MTAQETEKHGAASPRLLLAAEPRIRDTHGSM